MPLKQPGNLLSSLSATTDPGAARRHFTFFRNIPVYEQPNSGEVCGSESAFKYIQISELHDEAEGFCKKKNKGGHRKSESQVLKTLFTLLLLLVGTFIHVLCCALDNGH